MCDITYLEVQYRVAPPLFLIGHGGDIYIKTTGGRTEFLVQTNFTAASFLTLLHTSLEKKYCRGSTETVRPPHPLHLISVICFVSSRACVTSCPLQVPAGYRGDEERGCCVLQLVPSVLQVERERCKRCDRSHVEQRDAQRRNARGEHQKALHEEHDALPHVATLDQRLRQQTQNRVSNVGSAGDVTGIVINRNLHRSNKKRSIKRWERGRWAQDAAPNSKPKPQA